MTQIKDKGGKYARYRALKLKEKARNLSEKDGISFEEALEIVTANSIKAEQAIKPKKKGKRKTKKKKSNSVSEQDNENNKPRKKSKKGKRKKRKAINLISKRGKVLHGRHQCNNCNKIVDNPTRYAESNKGPVILCAICKTHVRKRVFKQEPRDALDYATTGGRFEGNRRKH